MIKQKALPKDSLEDDDNSTEKVLDSILEEMKRTNSHRDDLAKLNEMPTLGKVSLPNDVLSIELHKIPTLIAQLWARATPPRTFSESEADHYQQYCLEQLDLSCKLKQVSPFHTRLLQPLPTPASLEILADYSISRHDFEQFALRRCGIEVIETLVRPDDSICIGGEIFYLSSKGFPEKLSWAIRAWCAVPPSAGKVERISVKQAMINWLKGATGEKYSDTELGNIAVFANWDK